MFQYTVNIINVYHNLELYSTEIIFSTHARTIIRMRYHIKINLILFDN